MSLMTDSRRIAFAVVLAVWPAAVSIGRAQQTELVTGQQVAPQNVVEASSELPDAPSAALNRSATSNAMTDEVRSGSVFAPPPREAGGISASKFHRVVQPGQVADPLTSTDKLELSVISRLTVSDVASTVFSAGWSQMRDSAPHYGTDSGAFGERLGALALKQTSQSLFSYGIYASMFHDDPRYYVMGRQHGNVGRRALYSASQVFITQKDDGSQALNWPKFAGIASATALTDAYYPARDHGFANGAAAFGTSLWTSILNNEIHEFIGDAMRMVRHNQ